MTFLKLCQRLHLLLRAGQGTVGTVPATVTGQTGFELELVTWIAQSYQDLQNLHPDWRFRQKLGSLALNAREVDPGATLADYLELQPTEASSGERYITVYRDSVEDETLCYYLPYEQWAFGVFDRGQRSPGRPVRFTLTPQETLAFDPVPDGYTARFNYTRTIQTLAADADVPIIPDEYQMALVYWAMARFYGLTRDESDKLGGRAEIALQRELSRLRRDQLPEYTILDHL